MKKTLLSLFVLSVLCVAVNAQQLIATSGTASNLTLINPIYLGRTVVGGTSYSITATDRYVANTGTISGAVTFTLPPAASAGSGRMITIADESATVTGTNTLSVTCSGSNSINLIGTGTYSSPALAIGSLGVKTFISDGISNWTCDQLSNDTFGGRISATAIHKQRGLVKWWKAVNNGGAPYKQLNVCAFGDSIFANKEGMVFSNLQSAYGIAGYGMNNGSIGMSVYNGATLNTFDFTKAINGMSCDLSGSGVVTFGPSTIPIQCDRIEPIFTGSSGGGSFLIRTSTTFNTSFSTWTVTGTVSTDNATVSGSWATFSVTNNKYYICATATTGNSQILGCRAWQSNSRGIIANDFSCGGIGANGIVITTATNIYLPVLKHISPELFIHQGLWGPIGLYGQLNNFYSTIKASATNAAFVWIGPPPGSNDSTSDPANRQQDAVEEQFASDNNEGYICERDYFPPTRSQAVAAGLMNDNDPHPTIGAGQYVEMQAIHDFKPLWCTPDMSQGMATSIAFKHQGNADDVLGVNPFDGYLGLAYSQFSLRPTTTTAGFTLYDRNPSNGIYGDVTTSWSFWNNQGNFHIGYYSNFDGFSIAHNYYGGAVLGGNSTGYDQLGGHWSGVKHYWQLYAQGIYLCSTGNSLFTPSVGKVTLTGTTPVTVSNAQVSNAGTMIHFAPVAGSTHPAAWPPDYTITDWTSFSVKSANNSDTQTLWWFRTEMDYNGAYNSLE